MYETLPANFRQLCPLKTSSRPIQLLSTKFRKQILLIEKWNWIRSFVEKSFFFPSFKPQTFYSIYGKLSTILPPSIRENFVENRMTSLSVHMHKRYTSSQLLRWTRQSEKTWPLTGTIFYKYTDNMYHLTIPCNCFSCNHKQQVVCLMVGVDWQFLVCCLLAYCYTFKLMTDYIYSHSSCGKNSPI